MSDSENETSAIGSEGVCIKQLSNETRGRGVVATKDYKEGDMILLEHALVAMQSLSNMGEALVCAHCFQFLGSLDTQVALLGQTIPYAQLISSFDAKIESQFKSVEEVPSHLNAIVPCINECGQAYCSTKCRDQAYSLHHKKLCVGLVHDTDHPLVSFKKHAACTNEIFLQVAQVILSLFQEFKQFISNHPDVTFDDAVDNVLNLYPFRRMAWWDVMPEEEKNGHDSTPLSDILKKLCQESLEFLMEAWPLESFEETQDPLFVSFYKHCMNVDFFSGLIGMFERNQIQIRLENPLQEYFDIIQEHAYDDSLSDEERSNAAETAKILEKTLKKFADHNNVSCEGEEDMSDDEMDPLFPCFSGQALFPHICMMNHACTPSTQIDFYYGSSVSSIHTPYLASKELPLGRCVLGCVRAARDIVKGEELTNSYLSMEEQELHVEERNELLLDYGFKCNCDTCSEERMGK